MQPKKIIIIGAGPSGMMAAIHAAELGASVTLIEKNSYPGRKLLLSGKGRCNLTNFCDLDSFLNRFSKNGQFLRSAFNRFFVRELMDFFEQRGVKLKIERQDRVFPQSSRSATILEALKKELLKHKIEVIYKKSVKEIRVQDKTVKGVLLDDGVFLSAEKVILATGGISYAFTGSSGEGLEIAKKLGHKITPLSAGLVALQTKDKFVKDLEGLNLKNIRIRFSDGKRQIVSEIGELMFTGFGISGPLVLTHSADIVEWLGEGKNVYAEIDLKPALSKEQLHARLLREFKVNARKTLKNALKEMLPQRLCNLFIKLAEVDPIKNVSHISSGERERLVHLFKALRFDILKPLPIEEAMVTRGGVSLKEINPRTMESRLIQGLYFAGEMIDVDADTGGFNLQAAFSTGYLAGESAALGEK